MASKKAPQPPILEKELLTALEKDTLVACYRKHGEKLRLHNVTFGTVLRFVRGYHHMENPLEKTVEMLGKMIEFREERKVDQLRIEGPKNSEAFWKMYQCGLHGFDNDGHPVYIERPGLVAPDQMLKSFKIEEFQEFHIQMMESVEDRRELLRRASGQQKYKTLVILDLTNVGLKHLDGSFRELLKSTIAIDSHCYPETLYKMFIVNAPWYLKALWAIVSPFLDPITKEKIKFDATDLFKSVDPEYIPKFVKGGKCKCTGPCVSGPIPLSEAESALLREPCWEPKDWVDYCREIGLNFSSADPGGEVAASVSNSNTLIPGEAGADAAVNEAAAASDSSNASAAQVAGGASEVEANSNSTVVFDASSAP